jgi:hypothetical protein
VGHERKHRRSLGAAAIDAEVVSHGLSMVVTRQVGKGSERVNRRKWSMLSDEPDMNYRDLVGRLPGDGQFADSVSQTITLCSKLVQYAISA